MAHSICTQITGAIIIRKLALLAITLCMVMTKLKISWGNDWITQHNALGKQAGKPVVLEEYGSSDTTNHKTIAQPYQQTVLQKTSVAYDSFWQFATTLSDGVNPYDDYAIYYDTTAGSDYDVLGYKHAAAMLAKSPVATL